MHIIKHSVDSKKGEITLNIVLTIKLETVTENSPKFTHHEEKINYVIPEFTPNDELIDFGKEI